MHSVGLGWVQWIISECGCGCVCCSALICRCMYKYKRWVRVVPVRGF